MHYDLKMHYARTLPFPHDHFRLLTLFCIETYQGLASSTLSQSCLLPPSLLSIESELMCSIPVDDMISSFAIKKTYIVKLQNEHHYVVIRPPYGNVTNIHLCTCY